MASGGGSIRVLVVEDDALVAMLLEDMLAELGHQLTARASNFADALALAVAQGYDVAILDVNIDGKQVFPIAEALAARGIPFAFSTGHDEEDLPAPYRRRPVLQKPFQSQDLGAALQRLVSAPRTGTGGSA